MRVFSEWLAEITEFAEVTVCEASLGRMLTHSRQPFAIITAYRKQNPDGTPRTREQNIAHNRDLRARLNAQNMGVHQLIGHWQECQDSNIPYKQCPRNMLVDVIERSYFVPLPAQMPFQAFQQLIVQLGQEAHQDAVLISDGQTVKAVYMTGGEDVIGSNIALNQIGQAYSQHVLKQQVPFVFEGFEQVYGQIARLGYASTGIVLPPLDEASKTLSARLLN